MVCNLFMIFPYFDVLSLWRFDDLRLISRLTEISLKRKLKSAMRRRIYGII